MQFGHSIFGQLLKPISRRQFGAIVERHDGDAYDKVFDSWDHMIVMIYAQLAGVASLRSLESVWNANAHHHYHLGTGEIARSTLSDANARRPTAVFAETFAMLSAMAGRMLRKEGAEMVRLIDSSPIPLGDVIAESAWNGRIKGMKLHVVHDPRADQPVRVDITQANVNDVTIGRAVPLESGCTYVFDKGYCSYPWWSEIHAKQAFFVTRKKSNARFRSIEKRRLVKRMGDGFEVLEDCEVELASKGDSELAFPMRRIKVKRQGAGRLILLTNDMRRSAAEIAALYKTRWQIELLFRWIKQHLNLSRFLGRSANAVRLQLIAAMIAYLLLRLAARACRSQIPPIRFAVLVAACLLVRKPLLRIDKPPQVNASAARPRYSPDQMSLCYA
jgi:putative transposase